MKLRTKLWTVLIVVLFLLTPQNVDSCGPDFPTAVFAYQTHPGAPLQKYAQGNLGVVLPDFDYHYLFVAYRYLSDRPFQPAEIDQLISFWKWRIIRWENDQPDPVAEWMEARKAVDATAKAPEITTARPFGQYMNYSNCLPGAFHTAVLTLKDRAQRFGAASTDVREWLRGQDVVFSDCGVQKAIPSSVAENSPAWLKADRQYQIAAAYFYSGDFDHAAAGFDQISADRKSVWYAIAPYLAARAWVRKGTLKDETSALDVPSLTEAQTRLKKIINDPTRPEVHAAAQRMLAYLAIRLNTGQRVHELAGLLTAKRSDPELRQDLIDYVHGLNAFVGTPPDSAAPQQTTQDSYEKRVEKWKEQQFPQLASLRDDDLTDWILTFRYPAIVSRQHALEQWRKLHTLPWLVAAVSKIDAQHPATRELLQAAEKVPAQSPAYPTITYYRLLLLMEMGERDKVRGLLDDSLLPQFSKKLTPSSLNLFLELRMSLARTFDEFLTFAALPVVGEDYFSGGSWSGNCEEKDCVDVFFETKPEKPLEQRFNDQTAMLFNLRFPLDKLAAAAQGSSLPPKLRGEVAASTWTRAVMLGRHDIASTLAPGMGKSYPSLKHLMEDYVAAASPQEKWRAALFALISDPGLRPYVNSGLARGTPIDKIDSFRDNWWCADIIGPLKDAPPSPPFISPPEADRAKGEWKELSTSGTAPDYLTQKVLEWARQQPDDARLPEALHLAVRSTRYGCTDKQTSGLSRKAFDLLHSRYPNSKWAKETKYWY